MKTKNWVVLIAAIFVLSAAASVFLFAGRKQAQTVAVISDGQTVAVLELSQETELTVKYKDGCNTVIVKDGKVCVQAASCPDQNCVLCGERSGGLPIICLPNHLVLRFSEQGSIDGVTR